jgi:hypothetical protein
MTNHSPLAALTQARDEAREHYERIAHRQRMARANLTLIERQARAAKEAMLTAMATLADYQEAQHG